MPPRGRRGGRRGVERAFDPMRLLGAYVSVRPGALAAADVSAAGGDDDDAARAAATGGWTTGVLLEVKYFDSGSGTDAERLRMLQAPMEVLAATVPTEAQEEAVATVLHYISAGCRQSPSAAPPPVFAPATPPPDSDAPQSSPSSDAAPNAAGRGGVQPHPPPFFPALQPGTPEARAVAAYLAQFPLLAFVRPREERGGGTAGGSVSRRLARWFVLADVKIDGFVEGLADFLSRRRASAASEADGGAEAAAAAASGFGGERRLDRLISGALVNAASRQPISFAERRQFASANDFSEDRLYRDTLSSNTVNRLRFCNVAMPQWFPAPFGTVHREFDPDAPLLRDAHLCPFTLRPFATREGLRRYLGLRAAAGLPLRPPGQVVYRDAARGVSLIRTAGDAERAYCRDLFLVARCFLDNKIVCHDVDRYVFYTVAGDADRFLPGAFDGATAREAQVFAGYFSYERGLEDYNLACIVTLPCFQGRGLGQFLIAASYAVGRRRGIVGSPERPLSDLGAAAYMRYWSDCLWRWCAPQLEPGGAFCDGGGGRGRGAGGGSDSDAPEVEESGRAATTSVVEIARGAGIEEGDALETLLKLGVIHRHDRSALRLVVPSELALRRAALRPRLPVLDELFLPDFEA